MFFLFRATAPPQIYTLSLHDALPIFRSLRAAGQELRGMDERLSQPGALRARDHHHRLQQHELREGPARRAEDRKSTRLNSSHSSISYAVFCLKKKIEQQVVAFFAVKI